MMKFLIFLLIIIVVLRLDLKKIAGRTENDGRKNIKLRVPFKYFGELLKCH